MPAGSFEAVASAIHRGEFGETTSLVVAQRGEVIYEAYCDDDLGSRSSSRELERHLVSKVEVAGLLGPRAAKSSGDPLGPAR
jgi:hypothetical protein